MKRFKGLWRDTWWLWIVLAIFGFAAGLLFDKIFLLTIPISAFAFIYFGLMRYDENGNPTGD